MNSPDSIAKLIDQFHNDTHTTRVATLQALGDFGREENNRGILAEMGAVPLLSKVILHPFDEVNDTGVQKELALASRAIGNMCYEHGSVLEQQIIPPLVDLLQRYSKIVTEVPVAKNILGALTNMASEAESIQSEIVSNGGINALIEVITSDAPNNDTKIFAIRALLNVVDNVVAQNAILAQPTNLTKLISKVNNEEGIAASIIGVLKGLIKNEGIQKKLLEADFLGVLYGVTKSSVEKMALLPQSEHNKEEVEVEEEEEEEEAGVAEVSSDMLVELASSDFVRPHFWKMVPVTEILEMIISINDPNNKKLLKVQRNLAKCFGYLCLQDEFVPKIIEKLTLILQLMNMEDANLKLSGLITLANIARTDNHCKMLLENKICELVVSTITENPNDQRIAHAGLSVLHNLSISDTNKVIVASKGGILAATSCLKINSLLIQYEAIGVLKCLLSGNVPIDHRTIFSDLGGIQSLVSIVMTHLSDKSEEKPDPRVMFEACRLLCRLCEDDKALNIVGVDAIPIFVSLITTNFALLQCEGAQALYRLSAKGDYLDAIVQHLPKLVTPLQRETLPADQAKIAVLFILRTILNLMKKGYKDTAQQSTADVIRAWVSMQKGVVNDEIAALISQILN